MNDRPTPAVVIQPSYMVGGSPSKGTISASMANVNSSTPWKADFCAGKDDSMPMSKKMK